MENTQNGTDEREGRHVARMNGNGLNLRARTNTHEYTRSKLMPANARGKARWKRNTRRRSEALQEERPQPTHNRNA